MDANVIKCVIEKPQLNPGHLIKGDPKPAFRDFELSL